MKTTFKKVRTVWRGPAEGRWEEMLALIDRHGITRTTLLAGCVVAALSAGCSSDSDGTGGSGGSGGSGGGEDPNDLDLLAQVLETNADLAVAAYSDSIDTAEALKTAIGALVANPSPSTLDDARTAWLVANEPYGVTEVYRFRGSPIDDSNYNEEGGDDLEVDINAWPLGEALIDYVVSGTDFGLDQYGVLSHETGVEDPIPSNNIINSTDIEITSQLLSMGITSEDERDVISGYHAIEFLLWGQDVNEGGDADTPRDTTPGQRPFTDFLADGGCTSGTESSDPVICERRGRYLEVVVDKLIADLTEVRDAWLDGAPYREEFTSPADLDGAKARLLEILTGMGTLAEGELAGERMQIALSANSQEDEHSCFSDNTHRDIVLNAVGIYNSFLGDYAGYDSDLDGTVDVTDRAVTGYGIDDYLSDLGLEGLAGEVDAAFQTTEAGYTAIDTLARGGTPIDNQIVEANGADAQAMRDTIVALNAEAQQLVRIATELDVGSSDDVIQDDASDCDTTDPTSEC